MILGSVGGVKAECPYLALGCLCESLAQHAVTEFISEVLNPLPSCPVVQSAVRGRFLNVHNSFAADTVGVR